MYRYFLLIMLLFTSVALKAEGMPPSLAIMNYNVYMLDHHTDIFIGGTNPTRELNYWQILRFLIIQMLSCSMKYLIIRRVTF